MSGEVHTRLLSCGDTSEVGSYVPCSQLRDAACGEVRSLWITCVRRGKTTSGQVRVSIRNSESMTNFVVC